MSNIALYGIPFSPYVRKVRLSMDFKGLEYDSVITSPLDKKKPPEFVEHSPLGKIPLLKTDNHFIPDSSVICQWLEGEFPEKPLLPDDNLLRAKILWLEEYADTHMVSVIGGHLFVELVLAARVFKREANQQDIATAINIEIPEIFDYLSTQLNSHYLAGDTMTLADIAVGGVLVTLIHCDYHCDQNRWPRVASYIDRLFGTALFKQVIADEKHFLTRLLHR